MGNCEHGNELSGSINSGKFFENPIDFSPSDKEICHVNLIVLPVTILQRVIGHGLNRCSTAKA
jgi:hypothetical protein